MKKDVEHYREAVKKAAAGDIFFCAKFLYGIDFHVQRWLGECREAGMVRSKMDDSIENFRDGEQRTEWKF